MSFAYYKTPYDPLPCLKVLDKPKAKKSCTGDTAVTQDRVVARDAMPLGGVTSKARTSFGYKVWC